MVKNPETKKHEIIIRFNNFNNEQEAMDFATAFKMENQTDSILTEDTTITIH